MTDLHAQPVGYRDNGGGGWPPGTNIECMTFMYLYYSSITSPLIKHLDICNNHSGWWSLIFCRLSNNKSHGFINRRILLPREDTFVKVERRVGNIFM